MESKCGMLLLPDNVIVKGFNSAGYAIVDLSNYETFDKVDYFMHQFYLDFDLLNVKELKSVYPKGVIEEYGVAYLLVNKITNKKYVQIYGSKNYFTYVPKDNIEIIDIKFADNLNLTIDIKENGERKLLNYQTYLKQFNYVLTGEDLIKQIKNSQK